MELISSLTQIPWEMWIFGALSLSIGWGIRGNFGHEIGAAMPGALAIMAIVIMSGRTDWWERIHYFAMFGAIGWSFGGSMSYMQVISYTHSGHSLTIFYGFANLFIIGFLWAAPGGMAVAIPAILESNQLQLFFFPFLAVFISWTLQQFFVDWFFHHHPMQRHESPLYWYDTDWLDVLVAMIAVMIVVVIRGGFDFSTSLILHLGIGWYIAFLILVNLLKLRMTPPRGDNWAGCVGIVLGAFAFCFRNGLEQVALVTLLTGILGGIGFTSGQQIKLLFIKTGLQTNWHSILEQIQGFLFGIALVAGIGTLSTLTPQITNATNLPAWTHIFAIVFILVIITYLNHRKAAGTWVEQIKSLPEHFFGLPTVGSFLSSKGFLGLFEVIYVSIGIASILILTSHTKKPIDLIPESWLGRSQLLYLIFLWWIVIFNFERALTGFSPHRLVTEGVITFNAIIATILLALKPSPAKEVVLLSENCTIWLVDIALYGTITTSVVITIYWSLTRILFNDSPIAHSGLHIRFGPDRTATKTKPKQGESHP